MCSVFEIEKPSACALPVIFDSPHSGTIYPADFDYACDFDDLRTAEDHHVENLFAVAPDYGACFLHALFPRSYIDVNRAADDIDPALLAHAWDGPFPIHPTSRSDSGIGLIRRLVKPGIPVYDRPLHETDILHRLQKYYIPYHDALDELINEAHYNFGQVWHINCHSMPGSTAYPRNNIRMAGKEPKQADFVIGDRDGRASSLIFTRALRDYLSGLGYFVTINDPFKGVEILERHADPARGINSVQLEINKSLYMDEKTGKRNDNYEQLKRDIEGLIGFIERFAQSHLNAQAAD